MTKFEVTKRDGPARMGKLIFGYSDEEELRTPCVIGWERNRWIRELSMEWQFEGKDEWVLPSGLRISTNPEKSADVYIIPRALSVCRSSKEFVATVTSIRERIPPDSALYAPAVACPHNVALLIYSGIDLVDDVFCTFQGYKGIYMTEEGLFDSRTVEEQMCTCGKCGQPKEADFKELAEHNRVQLSREIGKIREFIRMGRMREYVEEKCRVSPWGVEVLRYLDSNYEYMEKRTPVGRSSKMLVCSPESLRRVEIRRFAERVLERFSTKKKVGVILPCSKRKPYSTSPTHRLIRRVLKKYLGSVQEVIITSPLGVVPRELERTYPASHYEIPVTGEWSYEEREWVTRCLREHIKRCMYERMIAHVDGIYAEICRDACKDLVELEITGSGGITSKDSLERLDRTLQDAADRGGYDELRGMFKSVADYQFGVGAGDVLLEDSEVSRKPSCQVRGMATLNEFGLLSLTLEGGRKLERFAYSVHVGKIEPRGAVLAPGILDADPNIRVGDEVLVIGENIFGVGRAAMSGWEMRKSRRGVAVKLRYVEER